LSSVYPNYYADVSKSFVSLGGALFFVAYDPVNNMGLWRSDGTEAGTVLLASPNVDEKITVFNGKVYFENFGTVPAGLWATDGTVAGTSLVLSFATFPAYPTRTVYNNSLIGITYDFEASQGRLGVSFSMGNGASSLVQCLNFGGTVVKDVKATGSTTGQFHAKNAPKPPVCPRP